MTEVFKEHDNANEAYVSAKADLFAKELKDAGELIPLANERLDKLFENMEDIDLSGNYIETMDLFVSFFDDVILECAEITDRRGETEENIIDYCKTVLQKAGGHRDEKTEHVTAKIIDCLNAAPSADTSKAMAAAVLDETNPLRLGYTYYEDFCKKNPLYTDIDALDYLKTEFDVRRNLILGNDQETFNALEKLLTLSIDTPEKYLLISFNSFYHGFEKDALNALNIGLSRFPENQRLLSAKDAVSGDA